jgi:hypothetical protein
MRWKADLPKMPRLPRVPLVRGESAAFAPPPAPSAYREENPPEPPPAEFKARSMLAEHKGLALLFLAAVIAFAWYCWKTPQPRSVALATPAQAAGTAQAAGAAQAAATKAPGSAHVETGPMHAPEASDSPIYVETLPDKER